VDSAPKNNAGTNTQRRGHLSLSQPAGPFDNSRTQRFADSITPTAANVMAASAVCVGSTVYNDVSPNSDNAVPSPTTHITNHLLSPPTRSINHSKYHYPPLLGCHTPPNA
jgi:hypothetical protein